MKIKWVVLVLMFSYLQSAGQIDFGLKADINKSTTIFHYHPLPYKWGYDAGINIDWHLHKKFFLSTQIQYSLRGYESNTGDLNLHYLSIPALCGYSVSKTFSLLLGIDNGILLHASDESFGLTFNSTYQYKPIDFAITGGIRWLLFKNTGLYFSYVLSLDLIEKPTLTLPIYDPTTNMIVGSYTSTIDYADNVRSQTFQLGIYYFFH